MSGLASFEGSPCCRTLQKYFVAIWDQLPPGPASGVSKNISEFRLEYSRHTGLSSFQISLCISQYSLARVSDFSTRLLSCLVSRYTGASLLEVEFELSLPVSEPGPGLPVMFLSCPLRRPGPGSPLSFLCVTFTLISQCPSIPACVGWTGRGPRVGRTGGASVAPPPLPAARVAPHKAERWPQRYGCQCRHLY